MIQIRRSALKRADQGQNSRSQWVINALIEIGRELPPDMGPLVVGWQNSETSVSTSFRFYYLARQIPHKLFGRIPIPMVKERVLLAVDDMNYRNHVGCTVLDPTLRDAAEEAFQFLADSQQKRLQLIESSKPLVYRKFNFGFA